jgi:undecaprenyl-diphosphatase
LILRFCFCFLVCFSFLLSIPAVLGALLLVMRQPAWHDLAWQPAAVGFAAAALSGMAALTFLVRVLRRRRLHWFAPYMLSLAALSLLGRW